jgi:hypothetical protein
MNLINGLRALASRSEKTFDLIKTEEKKGQMSHPCPPKKMGFVPR